MVFVRKYPMKTWEQVFALIEDLTADETAAAIQFLNIQKVETPKKAEGIEKSDFPPDAYAELATMSRLQLAERSGRLRCLWHQETDK